MLRIARNHRGGTVQLVEWTEVCMFIKVWSLMSFTRLLVTEYLLLSASSTTKSCLLVNYWATGTGMGTGQERERVSYSLFALSLHDFWLLRCCRPIWGLPSQRPWPADKLTEGTEWKPIKHAYLLCFNFWH